MGATGKPAESNTRAPGELVEAVIDAVQDETLIQTRREQICDAALALFLEKGFASTTIRDICARSGVNQASIYDYIANKQDILRRLLNKLWFRRDIRGLSERLDQAEQMPLEQTLSEYFRDTWRGKRHGTVLAYRAVPHLQPEDRAALRRREEQIINDLARQLRARAGLAHNDQRAEVLANLVFYIAAFAPLRDWLHTEVDETLVLDTVAGAVAAMIDHLGRKAEDADADADPLPSARAS